MNNKINRGFIAPKVVERQEFKLGGVFGLPKIVVKQNGQWDDSLPTYEAQYTESFDTYNCTAYGTLNAIEMIIKAKYGFEFNYSERHLGILSGTRPPGNDPHKVAEALRKGGVVDDTLLPLSEAKTVQQYYSPDPLTKKLIDKGLQWLSKHNVGHEWVLSGSNPLNEQIKRMKEALMYSPLGVGVNPGLKKGDLYIRPNKQDTHWCVVYGYEEGKYWKVFDTYDGGIKKYAWDYNFYWVKRFHVERVLDAEDKNIIKGMMEVLRYIAEQLGLLKAKELEQVIEPETALLDKMAGAIKKFEGWYPGSRSFRNKNPGNLRRGEWKFAIGYDKDNFAIFRTEEHGMQTLKNMISNAALGKSKVYKPGDSLVTFFKKYAPAGDGANKPVQYATFVAKEMSVDPFTFQLQHLFPSK